MRLLVGGVVPRRVARGWRSPVYPGGDDGRPLGRCHVDASAGGPVYPAETRVSWTMHVDAGGGSITADRSDEHRRLWSPVPGELRQDADRRRVIGRQPAQDWRTSVANLASASADIRPFSSREMTDWCSPLLSARSPWLSRQLFAAASDDRPVGFRATYVESVTPVELEVSPRHDRSMRRRRSTSGRASAAPADSPSAPRAMHRTRIARRNRLCPGRRHRHAPWACPRTVSRCLTARTRPTRGRADRCGRRRRRSRRGGAATPMMPWASSQRSASIAALQPSPAAVTAWR